MSVAADLLEIVRTNQALFDRHGVKKEFPAGECIFREGETDANKAFLILDGQVEILRQVRSKEKELALVGTGEIVGEVALFSIGPRTATARAKTNVSVIEISNEGFARLKAENIQVAYALLETILNIVANRLRAMVQRFEVIYFWLT